ncbi:hypothetical protein ACFXJ6_35030 [Streptomyces sp. NPDC059218]|uniref:hypothetical protein n=1 Tax=unclassified Streptomyces TaxID=2593676 RepID=UPI0036A7F879
MESFAVTVFGGRAEPPFRFGILPLVVHELAEVVRGLCVAVDSGTLPLDLALLQPSSIT